jgi:outer-membrane receptor for ferric coprogen and ferric-rhodotorulic acid
VSRSLPWLASAFAVAVPVSTSAQEASDLEEVHIIAVRDNRTSKGATGLTLDLKETPQSISVVSRDMMDTFGASDLNDALRMATGITVEEWETNRTNYEARGFEIKNTQLDGVGLPNNWGLVTGAMDSYGFEKLEVIRGANGLLTGVGNSSGTINYVRKRPLNVRRGELALTGGSYDMMRLEADYSTPLVSSGAWAGRLVVAAEDEDSYLRGLQNDRIYAYGVIDGQLTENSTLAVGYSYQKAKTKGNMWGALVFVNTDGTQAEFDTSSSTTQDWTRWDATNQNAFLEYTYQLPRDWQVKVNYNYREFEDDSKLFFAYSNTGLDPDTRLGLVGWPGSWPTEDHAHLFDTSVAGQYSLFGETHQAMFGVSRSKGERTQYQRLAPSDAEAWFPLPAFPYALNAIPEPQWGPEEFYSDTDDTLTRYYGATRLKFGAFATVLGFNAVRFHRIDTLTASDKTDKEVSPYVGLSYDIAQNITSYASYSDIYQPQDYTDITGAYLDPSKGVNYEVGVKADWFDKRLLTTLALFKAEQNGLGEFAGYDDTTGTYFYEGKDAISKGVELEVAGRLGNDTKIVFGFTSLSLEDGEGAEARTFAPRRTLNLSFDTRLPRMPRVSVGLGGQWRSSTSTEDSYTGIEVRQDSYALLNAFARWNVTERMELKLNVSNLTDEKYITSLYQVGFYGAPRRAQASFKYTF